MIIPKSFYYAICTESLRTGAAGMEHDSPIIERELKQNNPHFDHDEQSLFIELGEGNGNEQWLVSFAHKVARKYAFEYIQIWKKTKEENPYEIGIQFEVTPDELLVSQTLIGTRRDWLFDTRLSSHAIGEGL